MITVSKDGSGQFNTIQAALDSIPENNSTEIEIYIKKGIYKEKLSVSKPFVTFIGGDAKQTIITYDDYAKKIFPTGEVYRTFNSYTIFIEATNFTAKNITFENSAGVGEEVGQAVAVYVEGDKTKFKNCRFLANQDTLFTGPLPPKPIEGHNFGGPMDGKERIVGRQYYENCYIEGDIDFIFGSATAVFNKCEIFSKNRNCDINGYVTAASTVEGKEFGYVFIDCSLTSNANANSVYLGRPWRDYAKTAFINCYMGEHIIKEAWHSWNKPRAEKESSYVEYNSYGPGASNETRISWSHILTNEEAEKYTILNVLCGNDNWDLDL
ncbi:pectinesterase A precursor [Clostridium puniceum]|uniref:Pectinesterase n=1 Tax=Clostridium puniceum TaxID=29367 RepID=A0A1S8TWB7_9CLOT|nr:pectinesterase family protein [Clostridium puniceum]OOM81990.1 pectinesterase A precursor [Clostridium puniceum]